MASASSVRARYVQQFYTIGLFFSPFVLVLRMKMIIIVRFMNPCLFFLPIYHSGCLPDIERNRKTACLTLEVTH